MKQSVVVLSHAETPAVQTEAIQKLRESWGENRGREIIEQAVFDLADRLWKLEKALYSNRLQEVKELAHSLIFLSAKIGLAEFSLVASDLNKCLERNDMVSTMAVSARLLRVGERSLIVAIGFPEDVF